MNVWKFNYSTRYNVSLCVGHCLISRLINQQRRIECNIIETRHATLRWKFLSVFSRNMISLNGSLCSQTIREAKGTRIKTFQSGLFRPTIYTPGLAFVSPLWRNWKNTEETEPETPRHSRKMAHRKFGLSPLILRTRSDLIANGIEGERREPSEYKYLAAKGST